MLHDRSLREGIEGKDPMKVKNASLQQLIAAGFGWLGPKLYAVANDINQAVLGFTQTTTSFKMQQQLPRHISIPDTLNMQGQVARCYAETCFQKFVSNNLQRLRDLSQADLIKEFAGLKLEPEARLCVDWHGGSTEQAADDGRGKKSARLI